jgi:hypothetical protein
METDQEQQDRSAVEAMQAAGVATDTGVFVDYFGFEQYRNVYLPDGVSFVTIQALNEGARRQYLNQVNKDIRIERQTGDAKMKVATGDDRHTLLQKAIVGWNLKRRNEKTEQIEDVPFSDTQLEKFLKGANPKIIDIIEKEVRKDNEWLVGDVTIEDIDKQIEELQELRARKVKEEEGKGS